MRHLVSVQFSGNAKEYSYTIDHLTSLPVPGDRVVVPNKLKDDGTLSLTIANVISVVEDHALNETARLMPVVSIIPLESIATATKLMPKALAA